MSSSPIRIRTDAAAAPNAEWLTLRQAAAIAGVTTERIRELAAPRPTHPLPSYMDGRPLRAARSDRGRWAIDPVDLGRVVARTRARKEGRG